ncbi:uncharacterized protein G2W53_000200 [Senna tora]|uniref:Uncharacterized protein n=1 Tax=Senna tora TaxID=362788 RepID=A0A834XDD7_9FABA|nr:uncharacterized protein G2W53_000200 [Senna tora]
MAHYNGRIKSYMGHVAQLKRVAFGLAVGKTIVGLIK